VGREKPGLVVGMTWPQILVGRDKGKGFKGGDDPDERPVLGGKGGE